MAEDRYLDFDAARAARRARRGATLLRAFGEELAVPSSPPMGFLLLSERLRKEHGDKINLSMERLVELLGHVVGADAVDVLVGKGLELEDLDDLLNMVTDSWKSKRDGDGGEAPAPETGADSSTT